MSVATSTNEPQRETSPQPLVCRLCHTQLTGRGAGIKNMAEFELANVSSFPVDIKYDMTVLQFLNLIVTDAHGRVISEEHFGDRFAPMAEPALFRLEPGAKIRASVHLFATLQRRPISPGTYSVQAVYEYDRMRCVSDPLLAVIGD